MADPAPLVEIPCMGRVHTTARGKNRHKRGRRCPRAASYLVQGQPYCLTHANVARGVKNPRPRKPWNGKLLPTEVQAIRARVQAYRDRLGLLPEQRYRTTRWEREEYGVESFGQLGARYGVSEAVISYLVAGKSYVDVPEAAVEQEMVHA